VLIGAIVGGVTGGALGGAAGSPLMEQNLIGIPFPTNWGLFVFGASAVAGSSAALSLPRDPLWYEHPGKTDWETPPPSTGVPGSPPQAEQHRAEGATSSEEMLKQLRASLNASPMLHAASVY
jgi:hypothetical protein